jgi:hypothetical protein
MFEKWFAVDPDPGAAGHGPVGAVGDCTIRAGKRGAL